MPITDKALAGVYRIAVFGWGDLAGNPATVAVFNAEPDAGAVAAVLAAAADTTCCLCWPQAHAVEVRCFGAGRPIRLCGHGLLAAAHVWLQRYGQCPPLRSGAGSRREYHIGSDRHGLWLRLPRPRCRAAALPANLQHWFSAAAVPLRSAIAGGNSGYRILEWAAGTDLALLQPQLDVITRSSTRAVIATQADGGSWSFTLRYFAPQFGNPEDSATGSATAVLADYWAARSGARAFRALQCSPAGGVIDSRIDDDFVYIGGAVSALATGR